MAFTLKPLTAHTGAAITGIDLRETIDDADRSALQAAFARHAVLVFRDQALTPPQFARAAELFGTIMPRHDKRLATAEHPLVHSISNQPLTSGQRFVPGTGFHTDHSNDPYPPKASLLHAVSLPDQGGDTQFVNMHEAYDALPAATRRAIDGLQAIHVYESRFSTRKLKPLDPADRAVLPPPATHPLVRVHPDNGRRALYINPIRIEAIVGLEEGATRTLLEELFAHGTQPRFEYRHRWQAGDMVMWDNRSLMHKANADYDMSQTRFLYRLMLKGEAPAGIA